MEASYVNNLVRQVKFAGFGDTKELEIRNRIANNEPSFQVHFQPDFKNPTEATINIRRSDKKDDYYFNSYDISVKKEGAEPLTQKIYTDRPGQDKEGNWVNSTITLKEAYNMMDIDQKGQGRSVLKDFLTKDGEGYQSWIKLDFTTKNENGNYPIVKSPAFDLESKLAESNIKDISDPAVMKRLKDSLEKGNEINVRESFNNSEVTKGIIVNPQFKNFRFVAPFPSSRDQEIKNDQANDISQTANNAATQSQTASSVNTSKPDATVTPDVKGNEQGNKQENNAAQTTGNNVAANPSSSQNDSSGKEQNAVSSTNTKAAEQKSSVENNVSQSAINDTKQGPAANRSNNINKPQTPRQNKSRAKGARL